VKQLVETTHSNVLLYRTILDDSIMEIIDSVLDNTGSSKSENKENSITEMKR
jgi:hypothetical protein